LFLITASFLLNFLTVAADYEVNYVRSEVLTAVACCLIHARAPTFRGIYRLHVQARKVRQATSACRMFLAGFLIGLLFDPEDGGTTFLQNISTFFMVLQPKAWYSDVIKD
jgi:hypothetical protein